MSDDIDRLQRAIAALDAQRATLGDDVVLLAQAPLREHLAGLLDAGSQADEMRAAPAAANEQSGPATGAQEPAAQQLRQVSVLFTDVVGSTSLSQHLGPEDIAAVMDGALANFTHIVERHGGSALQYAGDSMLAVFGSRVAREDDAERAVLAGLDILAQARVHGAAVEQLHHHSGFGVRAGIATGGVLLGGGVDAEHSIRGMTVNLAARMEQTAAPGTLRICPDTRRLVRGQFELVAQAPLQVKGFDEAIHTWLVDGVGPAAAPQARRGVGDAPTALIGRSQELGRLQQAYHAWNASAAGARPPAERTSGNPDPSAGGLVLVVVVGEAGLGKSRLAAEFRAWTQTLPQTLPQRALWLDAQAGERARGRPYGVLRQLFSRRLRILDSDTADVARSKWQHGMAALLRGPGDAAVLGHLLGLDFSSHDEVRPLLSEGKQLRDRAFFHASQALRGIAADGAPLLALIDDLHWADPGTLDFIGHLRHAHANLPLLLLATARPLLDEQRPGWASAAAHLRIDLEPLADDAAHQLANALLARLDQVPDELRDRLTQGAEGNPFFMEELVNMLIDRGVIVADGVADSVADSVAAAVNTEGRWTLRPARLGSAQLPSTLAGVLQARLDTLPPEQAHALQLAAIVGHVFWDDALRALGLSGALPLPELSRRQFITQRPSSSLEGRHEFAFRHHLMHQICYARVLRRVKVPAHARLAQWLESLPGERPYDLIAGHHERGGQTASALDAWHKAAELALGRYANEQALSHAARALQLTAPHDLVRRYALSLLRAQTLSFLLKPQELEVEVDALSRLADLLGDAGKQSEAAERRASFHFVAGDAEAAQRWAQQAMGLAPAAEPHLAARAGTTLVHALQRLGRHEQALVRTEALLELARRTGDLRTQGQLLNNLGMLAHNRGDIVGSIRWYEQALQCHRQVGALHFEAGVLSNLGYAELGLGDYERARAYFGEASGLLSRIGQRNLEAIVLINLAIAALNSGQADQALSLVGQALPILDAAGSRWAEAAALRVSGQAHLALGSSAQAVQHLTQARDTFTSLGLLPLATEASASLASAQWAAGERPIALAQAQAIWLALNKDDSVMGAEEPLRVYLECWEILHATGDSQAPPALAKACGILMQRALAIDDPARRDSFMHRVPHHRRLLEAWQAGAAPAPTA